ncbi:MAG: bifunctional riboflavin kinase/FAD synthetase, partial [Fusobacteriaceae bacterium]|nr:bifunctional riboflavin kinase/FAD synthetase [Fusobacteriaceae bacterium]
MEIIRDIYAMEKAAAPTYIAIGSFDGIHPGHRKLIGETIRKAREAKGKSVVFTFSNHPLEIVKSDFKPQFITTLEEKTEILQQTGIDILVLQPFTKEFAALEPGEFLQLLRDKLNAKELFVGFNFTFGNKGKGTAETLTAMAPEFQMDVTVLPPVQIRKKTLSSTLIRDCIREGNMEEAARYLGYPFFVEGSVVHGEKIARNLGFPTANLTFDGKIIPRAGVYGGLAVTETGGAKRPCLINIGDNPAPREGERVLEAHIFNFGGDLYGKVIRVELLHYLREQKKFDSVELLKEAIRQDAENWKREYLKNFTGRPGDPPVDMEQIVLKLDNFEGPLDLLLTLIHKKKLKIAEIRMSQLIDDYLEVVNQAGGENLEVRVEFSRVAT